VTSYRATYRRLWTYILGVPTSRLPHAQSAQSYCAAVQNHCDSGQADKIPALVGTGLQSTSVLVYLLAMFTLLFSSAFFFWIFFLQWLFDPIPGHDLPVRDFGITLIGPITLGRSPLDERSARRRERSLKTNNTQQRPVLPAGFETTVPASFRPQTHALDRAVTGIGFSLRISKDI
jgi:hypothetical protein